MAATGAGHVHEVVMVMVVEGLCQQVRRGLGGGALLLALLIVTALASVLGQSQCV